VPRLLLLRRILLLAAATIAVLVVVLGIGATTAVRRSLPDRDGEVQVPGLSAGVTVRRDARGVPQVYADNATDLFMAQGFVQAQDRFFEMDYRRHVTAGRLSELVGFSTTALEADKVIRTLGWRRVAEQELPRLSPATRRYLQAYADGVNAYIGGRSPSELGVEYAVLGLRLPDYRVEEWTPVDSLAWLKAMAWDLKGNYDAELTRGRLSATLSNRRVDKLYPPYPADRHQPIVISPAEQAAGSSASRVPDLPADRAIAATADALDAVPALLGRGAELGSNAWVVSGRLTTTGRPLLANDPHLGLQVPSTWYQMGLHCRTAGPECPFDVAGFTFAGLPGVIIGHNAQVAWGFTNMSPDVTDFFLERVTGDRVERDGTSEPITNRTETIRVRGGADVPLIVRSTRHGPILSDVADTVRDAGREPLGDDQDGTTYDVALSWTALTPGRTADAIFALNQAGGWQDFRNAAEMFEVPAQNLIYADVQGNIGYQAPGRVPIREGSDGRRPVPGWDSRFDWKGYLPFAELPSLQNPPEGFLVTANQAVTATNRPFLTADWAYGYRSQRIRDLIQARVAEGKVGPADMAAIQLDTRNNMAPTLVPLLLRTDLRSDPFTREAQQLLRGWDFSQPPDSAAAAYYNAVWSNLLRLGFDDELGSGLAADGGERWYETVTQLLDRRSDAWWDDRATPGAVENRDEIVRRAMVAARIELTRALGKDVSRWQWGRLHRLDLRSPVLGGEGVPRPVRSLFNLGPYQLGGGSGAVDATAWNAGRGYEVTAGPSMRMVVDVGQFDRSTWVNVTGTSGHPVDSHYDDQVGAWREGRSFSWPFTDAATRAATDDEQQLVPRS
jgi:penicillin amidase